MVLILRNSALKGLEQNEKDDTGGNISQANIREDGQHLCRSGAEGRLFC